MRPPVRRTMRPHAATLRAASDKKAKNAVHPNRDGIYTMVLQFYIH